MDADLVKMKNEIFDVSELAALQVLRLQSPGFDDVTLTEAYKVAGSEWWLRNHIKRGNIKGRRKGTAKNSPVYFSRTEIAALRKAEGTLKATFKEKKHER
jgi:hypothetical protein